MAIRQISTVLLDRMFTAVPARGRLMIFGRPTMMWDDAPTPEDFFKSHGFSEVHTLDVSSYQGASHIHDLNNADVPPDLMGKYDMVQIGGTVEHVFRFSTALRTAAMMVAEGGWIVGAVPVNNWIDHGFYQASPTLIFDYFDTNGFEFGYSTASLRFAKGTLIRSVPLYPREAASLNFLRARVSHSFAVKKLARSTVDKIPLQSAYTERHGATGTSMRFAASEPFELKEDGLIIAPPMERIDLTDFKQMQGHHIAMLPPSDHLYSARRRPFRSRALVYEDGKLLPWIVSDPAMVLDRPGSFHHGFKRVHFSATDGSDPRSNGRRYEVAFPDLTQYLPAFGRNWESTEG